MFLAMANGQENPKTLILKDKKKKTKKSIGILNLGRRFRGPAEQALGFTTLPTEGDNQTK